MKKTCPFVRNPFAKIIWDVKKRKEENNNMASRRSQRTDDGTPLSIIQEELFEIQRQRRQSVLAAPSGPPPDMPYYASVNPPNEVSSNFTNTNGPLTTTSPPKNQQTQPQTQPQQQQQIRKNPNKKKAKSSAPALVGLQDPMDVSYDPSLVQERVSNDTVRRVKVGLLLTLFLFVCMYAYPVISNVPEDKRLSALATLGCAIGLGALGASFWPLQKHQSESERKQERRDDDDEPV